MCFPFLPLIGSQSKDDIKVDTYNVIMIYPANNLSLLPQNGITIIYKWIIRCFILSEISDLTGDFQISCEVC